jgi:CHU_C Type IX secretion signal domain
MRPVLSIVVFCLFAQPLWSQAAACSSTCTGNLGENIFPDGDFGRGIPNIVPYNPGIAPGYIYTLSPPPNDGFYTLTNNTTPWGSFAGPNWINIEDNGPEPNGYMMVVNASFQPGEFYRNTVSVCENTKYELSIDVVSVVEPAVGPTHIQSDLAFQIDGVTVCETGRIPHDKRWYTYRFSFSPKPGVKEVTLSIRNNAPGGIGNDLALDNISFRACGPQIDVPAIDFFCIGQSKELSAVFSNSPYTSTFYQWQFSGDKGKTWDDLPSGGGPKLLVEKPADGQNYRIVAANSTGNLKLPNCRAVSDPTELMVEDLSKFQIGGRDTIVCNGAPATLKAGAYARYQWSTGSTADSTLAATPGLYFVTITSIHGCTATDFIDVFKVNLAAEAEWDDPVCFGDSTGKIRVLNLRGGSGAIRYALDGLTFQQDAQFFRVPAGQYTLLVVDSLGCRLPLPVKIVDPPRFEVSIGDDRKLVACDSFTMTPSFNRTPVAYRWTPKESLSCSDCPNPLAMPLKTTTYVLQVRDDLNCRAADSLTVTVEANRNFYAPNVLMSSLSGAGENYYFTIFPGKFPIKIRRLSVYDRWGDLVFQEENGTAGDRNLRWDGTDFRGKRLPAGVYVWAAELEFEDGSVNTSTGDVTLVVRE